ncbi:MAG TPA: DUF3093 domain-containing protein [Marmoricola sp.]
MPTSYLEHLRVPLRWWVQATMFLATVWLAFIVSTPAWIAWSATAALVLITFGVFASWGAARVEVRDGVFYAGPAHIELGHIGDPEALDADRTRAVAGVEADVRAFLVLRPYVKRAVKVPITDPADPTPYWLVSTRHPSALAAALEARPQGAGAPTTDV